MGRPEVSQYFDLAATRVLYALGSCAKRKTKPQQETYATSWRASYWFIFRLFNNGTSNVIVVSMFPIARSEHMGTPRCFHQSDLIGICLLCGIYWRAQQSWVPIDYLIVRFENYWTAFGFQEQGIARIGCPQVFR